MPINAGAVSASTVQTYTPIEGHGAPLVPAALKINEQGITLHLGLHDHHNFDIAGDRTPEVFVERRRGEWAIAISPDSNDVELFVRVRDDGTITVLKADGELLSAKAPLHPLRS